jgi:hypothetical protein
MIAATAAASLELAIAVTPVTLLTSAQALISSKQALEFIAKAEQSLLQLAALISNNFDMIACNIIRIGIVKISFYRTPS